jgi:hypothetical protein
MHTALASGVSIAILPGPHLAVNASRADESGVQGLNAVGGHDDLQQNACLVGSATEDENVS